MRTLTIVLLRYYDFSPPVVQKVVRWITTCCCRILYHCRFFTGAHRLPSDSFLVRVSDIQHISKRIEGNNIFAKYLYHGVVLEGDWDQECERIEMTPLFEFSDKVFVRRYAMEETDYYKDILEGKLEPYIRGEDHLRLRMMKHIELFEKIRDEGYVSQKEIAGGNYLDEVCISIDREGTFILEDGRHRFMIARCLNLESIPVIINRVHKDFWERTGGRVDMGLVRADKE